MLKTHLAAATALLAMMAPAAAFAQAQAAPAARAEQAQTEADGLPAWLSAAERGEMALLEAALRTTSDADERVLLEARQAASRGEAVHRAPALARLADGRDPARSRAALAIMTTNAFGQDDYAAAAAAASRLVEAQRAAGLDAAAEVTARTRDLAALLAGAPAQRIDGPIALASTPLTRDAVGLPRIRIGVNGGEDEAVVDTGAALTVLSAETAARLGVTALDGDSRVGNGIATTVAVRTGIADRMTIAGTVIRNVPVLIIDDSQLTFPQANYRITSILGLPVMRALRRVKIDAAAFTVEAPQPFDATRQNLFIEGNQLHVPVTIGGRETAMFIDTGANGLFLTQRFAAAHPELVATLTTSELRTASAGGTRTQRTAQWTGQELRIGERAAIVPSISIALDSDDLSREHSGVLGSSALRLFASHTFDFQAMRLEVGEPLAAAAARMTAGETAAR